MYVDLYYLLRILIYARTFNKFLECIIATKIYLRKPITDGVLLACRCSVLDFVISFAHVLIWQERKSWRITRFKVHGELVLQLLYFIPAPLTNLLIKRNEV